MAEEKPSQSFNISGGQLSNIQVGGLAGGDLTANQNQQIGQEVDKPLTKPEVVELITQLEMLLHDPGLPKIEAEKAIKHLEVAKEEAEAEEPDKEFAAKSLQRATKVLKEAGETVEAGTGLWQKAQPILSSLLPWLGVAASFFA